MTAVEQLELAVPNISNLKRLRDLMMRESSADEITVLAVVLRHPAGSISGCVPAAARDCKTARCSAATDSGGRDRS
jgi:hypothetical protein